MVIIELPSPNACFFSLAIDLYTQRKLMKCIRYESEIWFSIPFKFATFVFIKTQCSFIAFNCSFFWVESLNDRSIDLARQHVKNSFIFHSVEILSLVTDYVPFMSNALIKINQNRKHSCDINQSIGKYQYCLYAMILILCSESVKYSNGHLIFFNNIEWMMHKQKLVIWIMKLII